MMKRLIYALLLLLGLYLTAPLYSRETRIETDDRFDALVPIFRRHCYFKSLRIFPVKDSLSIYKSNLFRGLTKVTIDFYNITEVFGCLPIKPDSPSVVLRLLPSEKSKYLLVAVSLAMAAFFCCCYYFLFKRKTPIDLFPGNPSRSRFGISKSQKPSIFQNVKSSSGEDQKEQQDGYKRTVVSSTDDDSLSDNSYSYEKISSHKKKAKLSDDEDPYGNRHKKPSIFQNVKSSFGEDQKEQQDGYKRTVVSSTVDDSLSNSSYSYEKISSHKKKAKLSDDEDPYGNRHKKPSSSKETIDKEQ